MRFSSDYATVKKLLEQTDEFLSIITTGKEFPLSNYYDLTENLKSIKIVGAYMSVEDLFNLRRSLQTISDIVAFFNNATVNDSPAYKRLTE